MFVANHFILRFFSKSLPMTIYYYVNELKTLQVIDIFPMQTTTTTTTTAMSSTNDKYILNWSHFCCCCILYQTVWAMGMLYVTRFIYSKHRTILMNLLEMCIWWEIEFLLIFVELMCCVVLQSNGIYTTINLFFS